MKMISVPDSALAFGFKNEALGVHASRTMMLAELRLLLAARPQSTGLEEYRSAIVDDNVLLKETLITRHESFRRLRELYTLNSQIVLFRALRDLWGADPQAQPLLALLCAMARDPLFRVTADLILSAPLGTTVTPQMISAVVDSTFPGRFSRIILAGIGRRTASSWQQAGHLAGRTTKVRAQVEVRPVAVTYALFLGYLCGIRGEALLETFWVRLLDSPVHRLREEAFTASQQGWLEYRSTGGVTDIQFRYLLRDERGSVKGE